MINRIWRKIVAFFMRSFTAECPHCHRHFYGFEPYATQAVIDGVNYRIVCPECSVIAHKQWLIFQEKLRVEREIRMGLRHEGRE